MNVVASSLDWNKQSGLGSIVVFCKKRESLMILLFSYWLLLLLLLLLGLVKSQRKILYSLRINSHYGHPNGEAVGFSGQTLLRVWSNELKLVHKIYFSFCNENNRWPLDRSLGFYSCPIQTSFKSKPQVKKYCHVGILERDDLWTLAFSVKGQEAKFLIFCNLIGWWKLMDSPPSAKCEVALRTHFLDSIWRTYGFSKVLKIGVPKIHPS